MRDLDGIGVRFHHTDRAVVTQGGLQGLWRDRERERGLKREGWRVNVGVEVEIKITDSPVRPALSFGTSVYR